MKIDKWNPSLLESYKKDLQEIREFYSPQIAMDLNAARKEGKAEGRMEEKKEMARSLLQNNVDISIIANSSGLSVAEIQSLKD